jgi:hypothetical protein
LPDQWKESIIVPTHKKGDKTDCNNYRGISLLQTSYKMLSNILLSRLSPYIYEIIGDHQCGFRHNRSTTDQTIILPVVLYWCAAWFVILKEEHRHRVLENLVLMRILGPNRDEVTGGWIKLHNEELRDLYSSPSIIRMIKSINKY